MARSPLDETAALERRAIQLRRDTEQIRERVARSSAILDDDLLVYFKEVRIAESERRKNARRERLLAVAVLIFLAIALFAGAGVLILGLVTTAALAVHAYFAFLESTLNEEAEAAAKKRLAALQKRIATSHIEEE